MSASEVGPRPSDSRAAASPCRRPQRCSWVWRRGRPRVTRVCRGREGRSALEAEEAEPDLEYVRPMLERAQRIQATLGRHPGATDAGVAASFAVAALVSLYATFELMK